MNDANKISPMPKIDAKALKELLEAVPESTSLMVYSHSDHTSLIIVTRSVTLDDHSKLSDFLCKHGYEDKHTTQFFGMNHFFKYLFSTDTLTSEDEEVLQLFRNKTGIPVFGNIEEVRQVDEIEGFIEMINTVPCFDKYTVITYTERHKRWCSEVAGVTLATGLLILDTPENVTKDLEEIRSKK